MSRLQQYDYNNGVPRYSDDGDTVIPSDRAKVTKPFKPGNLEYPILKGLSPILALDTLPENRDIVARRSFVGADLFFKWQTVAKKTVTPQVIAPNPTIVSRLAPAKSPGGGPVKSATIKRQQEPGQNIDQADIDQAGINPWGMLLLAAAGLGLAWHYLKKN